MSETEDRTKFVGSIWVTERRFIQLEALARHDHTDTLNVVHKAIHAYIEAHLIPGTTSPRTIR